MHYMKCEQVLTEYLNTIDWVAFDAAWSPRPLPAPNPADPLTDHFRERSRAKVQLASAVLRQLEFARDLEDKEDIARHIRQTVKTFQFLLLSRTDRQSNGGSLLRTTKARWKPDPGPNGATESRARRMLTTNIYRT